METRLEELGLLGPFLEHPVEYGMLHTDSSACRIHDPTLNLNDPNVS